MDDECSVFGCGPWTNLLIDNSTDLGEGIGDYDAGSSIGELTWFDYPNFILVFLVRLFEFFEFLVLDVLNMVCLWEILPDIVVDEFVV